MFTTMFTVIIVVCLLKRTCMPSFVLIGCCVSKLHGHLCPYRNVWPEAVCCCFTRTTLFIKILVCLYYSVHGFLSVHKVSSLNSVQFLRCIRELKLKSNNNKMKNCENELLHF